MRRSPTDPLQPWNRGFARTAHILPPRCEVHIDDLDSFTPDMVLKPFLAALYRCGAKDAGGWLVAFIHAEYVPAIEMVRIHLHVALGGGMINVVDKNLRTAPSYAPIIREEGGKSVRTPRIRMSRKPLEHMPYPITYLLKSYWPSSWEGEIDGQAKRQARHSRIQGSAHTRCSLWMDRYAIQDISLLVGLYVSPNGFALTRSKNVNERKRSIG